MFALKGTSGCHRHSLVATLHSPLAQHSALHAKYRDSSISSDEDATTSSAWADEPPQFTSSSSTTRSRRTSKSQNPQPSYNSEMMTSREPNDGGDPFAAFRSYQTSAMLKAVGIGREGLSYNFSEEGGEGTTPKLRPSFSRGWAAQPKFTVKSLYQAIVSRCESGNVTEAPLYMIMKLADTREDARTAVDAVAAVRGSFIRKGRFSPFDSKLCALFTHMCYTCDAPDVLAEALSRANELGLLLSFNRVHDVLRAWGEALDLHKMETVVKAMGKGGIEPNTKTAYILIRAAVNSGRQDVVEKFAEHFVSSNVRLTPTTLRLVEMSRERARGQLQLQREFT